MTQFVNAEGITILHMLMLPVHIQASAPRGKWPRSLSLNLGYFRNSGY